MRSENIRVNELYKMLRDFILPAFRKESQITLI